MNIDIKRFALLTSAIAASVTVVATAATGCSSTAVDDTDVDAGDDDTTSSSSSGGSSSGGGDGGGSSSSSGGSSSGDGGATDAGSCLSGGTAIDEDTYCAVTVGSETCSGDEYFDGLCRGPVQNFIPAVATAAVECIKTSPICESDPTDACLPAAIAEACDDATAEAFCTGLAAANTCDLGANNASPYTVADCVAIAKALSTAGRAALSNCFEEYVGEGTTCDDETVGYCFTAAPYSYGFSEDL